MGGQKPPQVKTSTPPGYNQAAEGQLQNDVPMYFGEPNSAFYRYMQQIGPQLDQLGNEQTQQFQNVTANAASMPAGPGDVQKLQKDITDIKDKMQADQASQFMSQGWQGVMKKLAQYGDMPMEQDTKVTLPNQYLDMGGKMLSSVSGIAAGYGMGAKG